MLTVSGALDEENLTAFRDRLASCNFLGTFVPSGLPWRLGVSRPPAPGEGPDEVARWTLARVPHSRLLMVRRVEEEGWTPMRAAEAAGVERAHGVEVACLLARRW